jgi:hypothetical protein
MFEHPTISMFSNIEMEEFIQFSQFYDLHFLFSLFLVFLVIFSVLSLIFISSAHTMIKDWVFAKPNTSKTEDKILAIFASFVALMILSIISFAGCQKYPDFYYLHKNYVLTSNYYQKLSDAEKAYVKIALLGDEGEKCLENKICQERFNYNITFKKLDHIISEIKNERKLEKSLDANQTKGEQFNREFWELIQK